MKTKFTQNIVILGSLFFCLTSNAQQSVNASGGNGSGAGGSFSYTVGQIDYVSANGSNGSISQGVQQPFEIVVLGTNAFTNINLEMKAYPNPTTANLNLKITNYAIENLDYLLFDISGRIISQQKITFEETAISMENLSAGNYLLQIAENGKTLKTFKIIKK